MVKGLAASALAAPLAAAAQAQTTQCARTPQWARGVEGQRKADLGNGTYLNPIVADDHPDPTILKDGDDDYMTFSSFFSYPGIVLWHSTDLVNWTPIGPALRQELGTIWGLNLCKHHDRYYIHIPANPDDMAGRSS